MNWYAAHIVLFVKLKNQRQDHFPIWENIVLFRAESEDEAFRKAEQRGHLDAGDDGGSFRWEGEPAEWVFAGVRKLTLCEDSESRPTDGTEITYLEMEAGSIVEIEQMVCGEKASLHFSAIAQPSS